MAILSLNHKIFLRFNKLSLTKAIFYTFMQTPSGKTGDFPDGKRISMMLSGETSDFPDENYDCDENRYIVTNDEKQQKDFSFF